MRRSSSFPPRGAMVWLGRRIRTRGFELATHVITVAAAATALMAMLTGLQARATVSRDAYGLAGEGDGFARCPPGRSYAGASDQWRRGYHGDLCGSGRRDDGVARLDFPADLLAAGSANYVGCNRYGL